MIQDIVDTIVIRIINPTISLVVLFSGITAYCVPAFNVISFPGQF
jgi:hypothetical protein